MSTVRSLPRIEIEDKPSTGWKLRHLGFIMDENQMNVALTRAKRGLILVGKYRRPVSHNVCLFDFLTGRSIQRRAWVRPDGTRLEQNAQAWL